MTAQGLDSDDLLTPGEVARLFRVDPKTVTRWAGRGRVPSVRTPGGHHRFRRGDVEGLLNGCPAPGGTAPNGRWSSRPGGTP